MRTVLKTGLKMRIKINRITKEPTTQHLEGLLTASRVDGIVGYVLSLEEMAKAKDYAMLSKYITTFNNPTITKAFVTCSKINSIIFHFFRCFVHLVYS